MQKSLKLTSPSSLDNLSTGPIGEPNAESIAAMDEIDRNEGKLFKDAYEFLAYVKSLDHVIR